MTIANNTNQNLITKQVSLATMSN